MPERQPLISNRGLIVAEGISVATSVGSGVAGIYTESLVLGAIGAGGMFLAMGIEILRQRIKSRLSVRRRR